jgi:hypothetical protein
LNKQQEIHLTREGEKPDIGLYYLLNHSAGNVMIGADLGESLTRQPNEPKTFIGCWHGRMRGD